MHKKSRQVQLAIFLTDLKKRCAVADFTRPHYALLLRQPPAGKQQIQFLFGKVSREYLLTSHFGALRHAIFTFHSRISSTKRFYFIIRSCDWIRWDKAAVRWRSISLPKPQKRDCPGCITTNNAQPPANLAFHPSFGSRSNDMISSCCNLSAFRCSLFSSHIFLSTACHTPYFSLTTCLSNFLVYSGSQHVGPFITIVYQRPFLIFYSQAQYIDSTPMCTTSGTKQT